MSTAKCFAGDVAADVSGDSNDGDSGHSDALSVTIAITNLNVTDMSTDCYIVAVAHPTNTRFSLAVHLLTLLALEPGRSVDSTSLSVSPATNPVHVRRVLGQLREVGLVRSQPGAHGGWMLTRPPEQIDLGSVWRAVNRDDPIFGLHMPDPDCPTGQLVSFNLRALDRHSLNVIGEELSRMSVADMLVQANVGNRSPKSITRILKSTSHRS